MLSGDESRRIDVFCLDTQAILVRGSDSICVDRWGIVTPAHAPAPGAYRHSESCWGVLGVVGLATANFLVTIKDQELVGKVDGGSKRIFRASSLSLVSLCFALSPEQQSAQQGFQKFLDSFEFHYSPDFDFTHTLQRLAEQRQGALGPESDRRFMWNIHIARRFQEANQFHWVTTVTDAFVGIIVEGSLQYTLISRRSRRRQGTRFLVRGVDLMGNAANFVEHEQLVEVLGAVGVASWVQVRGSIPLTWQQKGDGELMPKPLLLHAPFEEEAHTRHWNELRSCYGEQPLLALSLVDAQGSEGRVGSAYEAAVRRVNAQSEKTTPIQFVWLDFHALTKGPRKYDVLPELLAPYMPRSLFCSRGNVFQSGVVRTNCIDCLDRTNVVQSVFARHMLSLQLNALAVSQASVVTDSFESRFKHLWSDNANAMSMRYTGVGALKTDYTRTGKRSGKGLLNDGLKSVKRLAQAIFKDSDKQLYTELLLGMQVSVDRRPPDRQSLRAFYASDRDEGDARDATAWAQQAGARLLLIELHSNCITRYATSQRLEKAWYWERLLAVLPLSSHSRGVRLLFRDQPGSEKLFFVSSQVRNQFLAAVSHSLPSRPIGETLSVITLSWRGLMLPSAPMQGGATLLAEAMFGSVPRDHAVVSVALQDVSGSVPLDDSNVLASLMTPSDYAIHLMALHLGASYELLQDAVSSDDRVRLAVFVAAPLRERIQSHTYCGIASASASSNTSVSSSLAMRMREQLSGPSLGGSSSSQGVAVLLHVTGVRPIHLVATSAALAADFKLTGRHADHLRPFNLVPGTRHVLWMASVLPAVSLAPWSSLASRPSLGHILCRSDELLSLLSSHPPAPPGAPEPPPGPLVCSLRFPVVESSSLSRTQVSFWGAVVQAESFGVPVDELLHLRYFVEGMDEPVRSGGSRDLHWRSTVLLEILSLPQVLVVELSLWTERTQLARGHFRLTTNAPNVASQVNFQLLNASGALGYTGSCSVQFSSKPLAQDTPDPVVSILGRSSAAPPPVPRRPPK